MMRFGQNLYKGAEQYGVSNVAITKTCKKMRIPLSGIRYWNKAHHGR